MANLSTNINQIASNQASKEVVANGNFDAASPAMLWGRNYATTNGLTWGYYGGNFQVGATSNVIVNGTITLTASTTNYVYANATTGAVSSNTTGFPAGSIPLYQIVTGASAVTNYTDLRSYAPSAVSDAVGLPWSSLANPSANLSLTMAGYTTTFSSTLTGTGFTWQQSTAATSGANQNSMALALGATYWTGSASANDVWTVQDVLGSGSNPTSKLILAHSGSTGAAALQAPAFQAVSGGGGAFPGVSVGGIQAWVGATSDGRLTFTDTTRTTGNRVAELAFTAGLFQIHFVSDNNTADVSPLLITGGQASGVLSIASTSGSGAWTHTGQFRVNAAVGRFGFVLQDATAGAGANITLIGDGSTTPSKTIRARGGNFEFINDAYTAIIYTITDNGRVSVYNNVATAGNGLAAVYALYSSPNLTAALASTLLYTVPASGGSGLYRATVSLIVLSVGTAGTVSATLATNNGASAYSQTTNALSLTAQGELTTTLEFYGGASQAVNFSTNISGGAGSFTYILNIRLEYLG